MKQEYVLPKFRIPGQANWLVRGVWFIAGVVTLSLGALGLAYWRRSATLPAATLVQAPAPAVPASAPPTPAPALARSTPARPASAPAAPVGPRKLAANKRPGSRFGAGRYHRARGYGKGRLARGHGKRGLAARRAYLRKKRLLAARRANAGWPAKPTAAAGAGLSPQRRRAPTAPTANKSKAGDPIDDILKNFK